MLKTTYILSLIVCSSMMLAETSHAQALNSTAKAAPKTEAESAMKDQVFGLWNVKCLSEKQCVASTTLAKNDANGKPQKIVEVRVASSNGKRGLYIQIPSGVLIRPGVEMEINDKTVKLDYTVCNPSFCVASGELTDDLFSDIKKSSGMKISVISAPTQASKDPSKVTFEFKLDGSGSAMKAIDGN